MSSVGQMTPGPWFADSIDDQYVWVLDSRGNYIAEMVTSDEEGMCWPDAAEANARAIAALPELVEALRAADDDLGAFINSDTLDPQRFAADLRGSIRDALAKLDAEGGAA